MPAIMASMAMVTPLMVMLFFAMSEVPFLLFGIATMLLIFGNHVNMAS
jgi:hypothetical protein